MLEQPIEASLDRLISSGCDRRLALGDDGLNPYGASTRPRSAMALGSCSCSSPSARAVSAAESALRKLRGSADRGAVADQLRQHVRQVLCSRLSLADDIDIALTPSGTDLELLALGLVAGRDDREIINVIVGASEVGSGTCNAASARHYDTWIPRGVEVVKGDPVNVDLASRVVLERVAIRDPQGEILPTFMVDDAVTELVVDAVAKQKRVLLHLVAHSKTGVHGPSLDLADRLQRNLGDDIAVLVDAAQGRLEPEAYQDALQRGFLVSVTGSKFFGGPPFSGALLVPPKWQPATLGIDRLPDGFGDYFCRDDMPQSWRTCLDSNTDWVNYGALLRWVAASAEIDAYFQLDRSVRRQVVSAFAEVVQSAFVRPGFTPIEDFRRADAGAYFNTIESVPTVFSIEVRDPDGTPWEIARLKDLHRRLNVVVAGSSDRLNNSDAAFHLGQPVAVTDQRSVIRIALGAPLIIDVATDRRRGSTMQQRVTEMQNQIERLADLCDRLVSGHHVTSG